MWFGEALHVHLAGGLLHYGNSPNAVRILRERRSGGVQGRYYHTIDCGRLSLLEDAKLSLTHLTINNFNVRLLDGYNNR